MPTPRPTFSNRPFFSSCFVPFRTVRNKPAESFDVQRHGSLPNASPSPALLLLQIPPPAACEPLHDETGARPDQTLELTRSPGSRFPARSKTLCGYEMTPATTLGFEMCRRAKSIERDRPPPPARRTGLLPPASADGQRYLPAFQPRRFAATILCSLRPPGNQCASRFRRFSNAFPLAGNAPGQSHWPSSPVRQTATWQAWSHWPSRPAPASPIQSGIASIETLFDRAPTFIAPQVHR